MLSSIIFITAKRVNTKIFYRLIFIGKHAK